MKSALFAVVAFFSVISSVFHGGGEVTQLFGRLFVPVHLTAPQKSFQSLVLPPTPTPTPVSTLLKVPPPLSGERAYKVPVLLYHYIEVAPPQDKLRVALATPPDILDAQFALLAANGYTTITLDELAAAMSGKITLPQKPVILSFDDGYFDFYANAYPLLEKYHMKAISFIPTGLIGGGNYMTWGQIEEMARSPYVVFEAHSVNHPALPKLSDSSLRGEIIESKRILESHVGYVVNWFAYPYGLFDARVVAAVKAAGFIGSATTLPGSFQYQSRLFYIPRYRGGKRTGEDFLRLVR